MGRPPQAPRRGTFAALGRPEHGQVQVVLGARSCGHRRSLVRAAPRPGHAEPRSPCPLRRPSQREWGGPGRRRGSLPPPHAPTLPTGNSRALTLSLPCACGRDGARTHGAAVGRCTGSRHPQPHRGGRETPGSASGGERDPRSWRSGCSETPPLSPREARPPAPHLGGFGTLRPTSLGGWDPQPAAVGPPIPTPRDHQVSKLLRLRSPRFPGQDPPCPSQRVPRTPLAPHSGAPQHLSPQLGPSVPVGVLGPPGPTAQGLPQSPQNVSWHCRTLAPHTWGSNPRVHQPRSRVPHLRGSDPWDPSWGVRGDNPRGCRTPRMGD